MTRRIIIIVVLAGIGWLGVSELSARHPATTTVSWDREISPIIQARCVGCHAEGSTQTMPLASYEAARPWARAIRQQVLTRRMPIWHAARGYGAFANDPSLSPFEIQLIVAWVDGGTPKTAAARVSKQPMPAVAPLAPIAPVVSGRPISRANRAVPMRCGDSTTPVGSLGGLRPQLDRGGSVRVTAWLPDGRREILGWFRDFDPSFSPDYWLEAPLALPAGSRIVTEPIATGSCSLILWMH